MPLRNVSWVNRIKRPGIFKKAFQRMTRISAFNPLPVSTKNLKKHSYIAAGSGHWKSELIKRLAYGLMQEGHGVIVLDPHGELALQIAQWKEFSRDPDRLIYFSLGLANSGQYVAPVINPLSSLYQAKELDSAVENFLSVFEAVVGADAELSSRMKTILKPCLYTLAAHEGATIYDILDFLDHEDNDKTQTWIKRAKATLTNRAQLSTLESYFDNNYKITKLALRDRLRTLLWSNALDLCIAGGESTIDLKEAMNTGKVVVFNLAGLGEDTCGAFGRFIVGTVQNIAMERHAIHHHERKPVFLFLDEADRFISNAVANIYKETRKYWLHLGIVQQITGYGMSRETFRAITGNSFVRFAGNGGADLETVRDLAKFTKTEPKDIESLKPLHFFIKEWLRTTKEFCLAYEENGDTRGAKLLGDNHQMTPAEWEVVKQFQLAHYYRPISRPRLGNTSSLDLPAPRNPINFYV